MKGIEPIYSSRDVGDASLWIETKKEPLEKLILQPFYSSEETPKTVRTHGRRGKPSHHHKPMRIWHVFHTIWLVEVWKNILLSMACHLIIFS